MRNSSNVWSVSLSGDDGPCLHGTDADLMEALANFQRSHPGAVFCVAPAEPAFNLGRRLDETLARARRLARVWPQHVITLGVHPHGADPQRGYLTLGDEVWGTDGMRRVTAFVDRPSLFEARELRSAGAMWNTMICCATVEALMIDQIEPADLVRDLFERAPQRVLLLPLDGVEWPEVQVVRKRSESVQVVSTSATPTRDQSNPAISVAG